MRNNQPVTGRELLLEPNVVIISRTDAEGRITFANDDFLRTSGFSLDELIGENHNILRHPDMPAEAFRDLWTTLRRGRPWSGPASELSDDEVVRLTDGGDALEFFLRHFHVEFLFELVHYLVQV